MTNECFKYTVYFNNGKSVSFYEYCDYADEYSFITQYEDAEDNEMFTINHCDGKTGFFLKKNVTFIEFSIEQRK